MFEVDDEGLRALSGGEQRLGDDGVDILFAAGRAARISTREDGPSWSSTTETGSPPFSPSRK